jgi:polyisoprenoid-binding protein YceI
MKLKTLVTIFVLALSPAATATEIQIDLDPEQTSISFRLQATLHSVHGSTMTSSGVMALDSESGSMTGEVEVDAATAETGNRKRDKKMHAKVLRSVDHPRILLRARRLEGALALEGASNVTLHGEMEILGRAHELSVPLHVNITDGRFTATAQFEIPYVDWGLEDPSTFVLRVAKTVKVSVEAVGDVTAID